MLVGAMALTLVVGACGGPTRRARSTTTTSGVSTSTSAAVAAGDFSWTIHQSPGLGGAFAGELSCPSVDFCAGVATISGSYPDAAELGLAVFNGGSWSTPTIETAFSHSDETVSCSAPTFCVAVSSNGLYVTWNGTLWSTAAALPLGKTDGPSAISCTSPTFCMVVNGELSGATGLGQTQTATWNGSRWTAAGSFSNLDVPTVSCVSQDFCMGAGEATTSSSGTLSTNDIGMTWNGMSWASPMRIGVNSVDLGATAHISCSTPDFCMATGGFHATGDVYTIWNGTSWTSETMDTATGHASAPTGFETVSCPSATLCVAVDGGSGTNGQPSTFEGPTVNVWNAGVWSGTHQAGPANALADISCPSVRYCVILGSGSYLVGAV